MSEWFQGFLEVLSPALFYVVLWVIIYVETALIVAFFLPGDTILFAAGLAVAASTQLDIAITITVICSAAIIGDNTAYVLGRKYGAPYITKRNNALIQKMYQKSTVFYAKYGISAMFLARFYPWLRTLIPFHAGLSHMRYLKFSAANFASGILWGAGITSLGYFAFSLPVLKSSARGVAIFFVVLTIVLAIYNYLKFRRNSKQVPTA